MAAIGELAPNQAPRLGRFSTTPFAPTIPMRTLRTVRPAGVVAAGQPDTASDGGGSGDLSRCVELLQGLGSRAVADAALLDFRAAADFAAGVEEAARSLEFLQVVAAGAVERTRREATAAARSGPGSGSGSAAGWVTGWGDEAAAVEGPVGWTARGDGWITGPGPAVAAEGHEPRPAVVRSVAPNPTNSDPADDGCPNAAEFLRTRLRISIAESRRRLSLAETVLPRTGITGHIEP
ncbi:HNH endonuclease, partial [Arthrobacter sp. NPDC093128]